MAIKTSYDVKFSCGHENTVDLSGKPAGKRATVARWLSEQPCLKCKRAEENKAKSREHEAENAKELEEANEYAAKLELPALTGSEKQRAKIVPWATRIRHQLIKAAYAEFVESEKWTEEEFETRILVPAREVEYCGWWLDNRDAEPEDLEELLTTADDEEEEDEEAEG